MSRVGATVLCRPLTSGLHRSSSLIPVKETSLAETHLRLPVEQRLEVALELALATLDSALAARMATILFVVTRNPTLRPGVVTGARSA